MWYEVVEGTFFLKKIYCDIPDLDKVRIEKACLMREGTIFRLSFDMPTFPVNMPKKWANSSYSAIHVTIDFFDVIRVDINYDIAIKTVKPSSVLVYKSENSIKLEVEGAINGIIIAQTGLIQEVEPY